MGSNPIFSSINSLNRFRFSYKYVCMVSRYKAYSLILLSMYCKYVAVYVLLLRQGLKRNLFCSFYGGATKKTLNKRKVEPSSDMSLKFLNFCTVNPFLILYIRRETPDPIPTSKSETAFYHMYCLPWETWVESKKGTVFKSKLKSVTLA